VRPLTREQFIYQPALEQTRRAGVARYPKRRGPLGHECTGLHQDAVGVDLTIRRTGPDSEVRQAPRRLRDRRRRRVQPDPRAPEPRVRGALLQGPLGRHRHEGHQALARGRPAAVPLQPGPPRSTGSGSIATRPARRWTAPPRWATTAGSSRCSRGSTPTLWSHRRGCWSCWPVRASDPTRPGTACSHLQPPRPLRRPLADRVFLAGDAAHETERKPGFGGCHDRPVEDCGRALGERVDEPDSARVLDAATCDQHVIA